MRSLFLRIFLWFWLVMALVIAVLVASSPYWTQVRPSVKRWERQAFATLVEEAGRIAEAVEWGGPESIGEGDPGRGRGRRNRAVFFDAEGRDISGRPSPPVVEALARRSSESGEVEFDRVGHRFLLARPVVTDDGRPLTLVLSSRGGGPGPEQRPQHPIRVLEVRTILPRLAVIVLLVGGLCFWLSRYLTSPLRALRATATGIAGGDMSARVGQPVAARSDEIGGLARDFDSMADRVEDLVSSQQRLLRDVSHELRSPLARLNVALELARSREGAELDAALDRIERESMRLDRLVGQLLTLTRIEAGVTRETEVVDLGAILEEIVSDAQFEAEARGCSVALRCSGSLQLEGERGWLRSAVENVVRNAVHYTADGSEVKVEGIGEGTIRITVRDRGPGVPEDDLEKILRPFHRVGDARERASGGVGLGLAITARVIRLHRGEMTLRNHPEGGLEVCMTLPAGE